MSGWKARRFWKAAEVAPEGSGYTVLLDGRKVKTPAKAALVVPTKGLAQAIAAEWQAQGEQVDPLTMPFTRSANAAIDKVTQQHEEVAELAAAYGDSDLMCYRATEPAELAARQADGWDPVLQWAKDTQGIELEAVSGIVHRPQRPEVLARIAEVTRGFDAFQLTAFHDLVGLTGSWVLGLAATCDQQPADALWQLSRIDETWQQEQWGHDDEAAETAARKREDFLHAVRFYRLVSEVS